MMQKAVVFRIVGLLSMFWFLAACDSIGYYSQAAKGQLSLLASRQATQDLIANEATDSRLRTQLVKAQEILVFAAERGLPVDQAYSDYVDLQRPYVVWNVFAAAKNSVDLLSHCFPIAGCVGYRGFFAEEDARRYATSLKNEGYDVYVGGVAAYSTLGWFNDPLLNTFLFRSDERLAAVLFHELAHRAFYLEGDTVFNESFATAVELHLLENWLNAQERDDLYQQYVLSQQRQASVIELILSTRRELAQTYVQGLPDEQVKQEKSRLILELQTQYKDLRSQWEQGNEFSGWMTQELNNAHFGAIGAYQTQVPGFTKLLDEHLSEGKTLAEFFGVINQLSQRSKEQRDTALSP